MALVGEKIEKKKNEIIERESTWLQFARGLLRNVCLSLDLN